MSYLRLHGQFWNLLTTPEGVNKEGQPYGGKNQLQLMCEEVLRNGEVRSNLVNLYVPSRDPFDRMKRLDEIQIPVGIFVPAGTKYSFFAAKENS